jgi:hypothetical protein
MYKNGFSSRTQVFLEKILLFIRQSETFMRRIDRKIKDYGLWPPSRARLLITLRNAGILASRARRCSHDAQRSEEFVMYGQRYRISVPFDEFGLTDYCPQCLREMTITCATSNLPIFVGDRVRIYHPDPSNPNEFLAPLATPWRHGFVAKDNSSDDWSRRGIWIPGEDGHGEVSLIGDGRIPHALPQVELLP